MTRNVLSDRALKRPLTLQAMAPWLNQRPVGLRESAATSPPLDRSRFMEIQWIGCPAENFRKGRPNGHRPEAVVVHIMDGSFSAGESVFMNGATQKSAHYGISRTGEVHQYVDESDTAFHAGIVVRPQWELLKPGVNPNFYTIGIEHAGRADDVWPDAQLATSASLIGAV